MPRARYTGDGGIYRIGRLNFEPGDEQEVDHEIADHLRDHEDFEVRVEKDADTEESDDAAETNSDDESEGESAAEEFDAESFVDRTPMDDVVEDIRAGEVDDHLDAVSEAADRVGVTDAVGERRADMEG